MFMKESRRLRLFQGLLLLGCVENTKPGSERVESGYYLGVQPLMDADDYCGEFKAL